jgi:transcriptional regulator with XRE-family HTH domain
MISSGGLRIADITDDIRNCRRSNGITQQRLAALLGITPNTVARWERGELPVQHPALLARALADLEREIKNKK